MDLSMLDAWLELACRVLWHALVLAAGALIGVASQGIEDVQHTNVTTMLSNGWVRMQAIVSAIDLFVGPLALAAFPVVHYAAVSYVGTAFAPVAQAYERWVAIAMLVGVAGTLPGGPRFLTARGKLSRVVALVAGDALLRAVAVWAASAVAVAWSIAAMAAFWELAAASWIGSFASWLIGASLMADAGAVVATLLRGVRADAKQRRRVEQNLGGLKNSKLMQQLNALRGPAIK